MKNKLKCFKLFEDVILPEYATEESACFDLRARLKTGDIIVIYTTNNKKISTQLNENKISIKSGDRVFIPTGIIFDIPSGFSLRLHIRSGLSTKSGLVLANSEGVIDSDYIEPCYVILYNRSDNTVVVNDGDRIAQCELVSNVPVEICAISEKPKQRTDRNGGFGSTGIN